MADNNPPKLTIDGTEYPLDTLTPETKAKVRNLRFVDAEILRLRNRLILCQAARAEFVRQLQETLPAAH